MLRWLCLVCALVFSLTANAGPSNAELSAEAAYQAGMERGRAGDFAAALPLIRQAAEAGHARAEFTLGAMYAKGQGMAANRALANQWYRRAAAKQVPDALFNLGIVFDRGLGEVADPATALSYYRQAAEAGHAEAAYNAGHLLIIGESVPADLEAGYRYIRQAADAGIARAQFGLAYALERGIGGSRDPIAALDLYARVEQAGWREAGDARIYLSRKVRDEGLALRASGDRATALTRFDAACRFGEALGCYYAGYEKLRPDAGPRKNPDAGLADMEVACRWGLPDGCDGVASAVIQGAAATRAQIDKAFRFYDDQCASGNFAACHNKAWMMSQPKFGLYRPEAVMGLLADTCYNKGYQPSCEAHAALYNSTLTAQGAGRSVNTSGGFLGDLLLGLVESVGAVGAAMGSSGSYIGATGSYGSASSSGAIGTTGAAYQQQADWKQFLSSVSSYGTPGNCRPGNPYC